MNRCFLRLALAACVFLACTTDIGIKPATNAGRGNIVVWEKNSLSAQIFLDYRLTNYKTPATIPDVPAGEHTVQIFSASYQSIPASITIEVVEKTNTEVEFELQKSSSGNIDVHTDPDGAMVSINDVEYGTSPLSVTGISSGTYTIGAQLGNYRSDTVVTVSAMVSPNVQLKLVPTRSITIEYFSNTSCGGCPAAGTAIDDLMEQLPQYKDLLYKISYHARFPSINDPFYLAAKDDQTSRINLYGVETDPDGLPLIYMNGVKIKWPLNGQAFITEAKQKIETILATPSTAELSFSNIKRDSLQASGTLAVTNRNADVLLHVALIEDFVGYSLPPGTNGQRFFHAIFRGFSPDANGLEIVEAQKTVSFSFDISNYTQSDLSVVAFLQDKTTKEIVQSLKVSLQ